MKTLRESNLIPVKFVGKSQQLIAGNTLFMF